jgi:tetratricopeptide (TPR) repeat protein
MMADPKAALEKARQAVTIAEAQPASPEKTEALATSLWLEGESLTRINKTADAQIAIGKATKLAAADGKTTALDGNLALSQARLADANGDIGVALKSYQRAHDIFSRLNIPRYQAIALQGLGSIYDKAHDFDREIEYYRRASQVYSEEPGFQLSAANNIGFALQQLGHYDEAIDDFQQALKIARTMQSPYLEANILTNLAAAYAKSHRFKEAESAANRALKLLGPKDESGGAPFVWGVKAEAEFQRGNISAAVSDIDRAFKGIDLKTTISAFRDMHEIAYRVYKAAGDNSSALAHLEAFKRLDDQGRSLTASANLALMNAQFEFANQKFEIEHLKSEQLKRDMSLRESRAATQRALFSAVLLAGLAFMLWISWRHMTLRRHRNELHKTLGERDIEIERRIEVEAGQQIKEPLPGEHEP